MPSILPAAIIGSSAIGAGASIMGSQSAAGAEQSAAQNATNAQLQMFGQVQQNLSPYNQAGQAAENQLMYGLGLTGSAPTAGGYNSGAASAALNAPTSQSGKNFAGYSEGGITAGQAAAILQNRPDVMSAWNALPSSTKGYFGNDPNNYSAYWYNRYGAAAGYQIPAVGGGAGGSASSATPASTGGIGQNSLIANFQPTEAQLMQTPGYQFNLQQGLESTQNAAAARGLGSSGAALKGAATYATGLADSTYQQQLQNYLTQQDSNFNRLLGITSLGENAGAGVGNAAVSTGQSIGNNITGAGNATAAADTAAGNSVSGVANNLGSLYLTNSLMQSNGGAGLFGGSSSPYADTSSWAGGPPASLYGG